MAKKRSYMNINTEQKTFTSSDLAIVAAISLYYPIIEVDKTNPRKAQFVFERTSNLDSLLEKYWNKELLIEPRAYFDQVKAIKTRLYAND